MSEKPPRLSEIKQYFIENPPTEQMQLSAGVTIIDPALFVDTHIKVLEAHAGDSNYILYYSRLKKYYEHSQKTKKGAVQP